MLSVAGTKSPTICILNLLQHEVGEGVKIFTNGYGQAKEVLTPSSLRGVNEARKNRHLCRNVKEYQTAALFSLPKAHYMALLFTLLAICAFSGAKTPMSSCFL